MLARIVLFVVGAGIPVTPCLAQTDSVQCQYDSRIGSFTYIGDITHLDVNGQRAFVSLNPVGSPSNKQLSVLDITDPDSPKEVDALGGPLDLRRCRVDGDYLYVAEGSERLLQTYVIEPDGSLTLSAELSLDANLDEFVIAEGHLYARDDDNDLRVFDLSSPGIPSLVHSQSMPGAYNDALSVIDGHLYVGGLSNTYVYALSDPSAPTLVNSDLGFASSSICEGPAGTLCVLSSGSIGPLAIFDLSDPVSPMLAASLDGAFGSLSFDGERILSRAFGSIAAVHADVPSSPFVASRWLTGADGGEVVSAGHVLVTFADNEVILHDGTRALDLPVYASIPDDRDIDRLYFRSIQKSGDRVYLHHRIRRKGAEVAIYDVSSPNSPVLLGSGNFAIGDNTALSGDYLHCAVGSSGYEIIDVSDPAEMARLGGYDDRNWRSYGVCVEDGSAVSFVSGSSPDLALFDYSDPSNPLLLGEYNASGVGYWDVATNEDLAYLGASDGSLHILNVHDATNITPESVLPLSGSEITNVVICDDMVYAVAIDGLYMVDVSDPSNPYLTSFLPLSLAVKCDVVGDSLYVAARDDLWVIDIAQSSAPVIKGMFDHESIDFYIGESDVIVEGGIAYMAAGNGGLTILDVSGPCETTCPADTNNDGVLTPADFSAWINAFNNSHPECDQNADGLCNAGDFTAWIANYNAGCP